MSYFFLFIGGLIIGSFLNVVIFRYPEMLKRNWQIECSNFLNLSSEPTIKQFNLAIPQSHCPNCQRTLSWWHNIPIISYLILRGKCSFCKRIISPQYPVVELISALVTVLVFWQLGWQWESVSIWVLSYGLIVLTVIDWKHQILPDTLTLSLLWLGLVANSFGVITSLNNAVWGALCGYLLLWLIAHIFEWIRKKPGMGYGDFKMLAMLGAWLGAISIPYILLGAVLLSLIFNLSLLFFKKINFSQNLPFGPWLAISGWLMLLFHSQINYWVSLCFA